MGLRRSAITLALATALLAPAGTAAAAPPAVESRATEVVIGGGSHRVVVNRDPWRLAVQTAGGKVVASEAPSTALGAMPNPDAALYRDRVGSIDLAYPGLPEVSYLPLSFRRNGAWQRVTRLLDVAPRGDAVKLTVDTSDGSGAVVTVGLEDDGAVVRLGFDPNASDVDAVAEAFSAPPQEHFLGGGQRFGALDQRGRSVPLWISHGQGSDRYSSTNEAAVPFLLSTGGWGFGVESDARGELNVGLPSERPDAVSAVLEDDHLDLLLFAGSPRDVLSAYTARAGRPDPAPPAWAFRPAFWRDEDTSQKQIEGNVARLRKEGIPVGAIWIDNPWESRRGDFAPDPKRFQDFDAMLRGLHAQDVRVMTWASPYASDDSRVGAIAKRDGLFVKGLPADGNDQTYLPPRQLDPHLDLSDPRATDALAAAAADLLRRGVDGFKADRGEEDLGDGSRWADGRPNRLNHNAYVVRYHAALAEACRRAGKAADCFIIARGGARGGQRHAALWAADNVSAPGEAGLAQALRSVLSLSVSGYPVSGSDIGGYVGTRGEAGEGFPTRALFLRWTQLGALSPVMQTPHLPWDFGNDAETIRIFRRFANLHTRLAPRLKRWSDEAAATGVPIVRPLPFASPDDAVAARIDDEYLLGPDLLVAPITQGVVEGPEARQVYLPAGAWRDAWTGERLTGPTTIARTAALDEMPLYVREGGELPLSLFAGLDAAAPQPGPPSAASCRDGLAPRSRFSRGRVRASRRGLRLRGTAGDEGCGPRGAPARVLVAVLRRTGRLCRSVSASGRLGARRACTRTRYRTVRGTRTWTARVRGPLPRGRYLVWVRSIDRAGNVERKNRRRNLLRLRIR
jgi:alpha-D-xyloside xylohydrolase